MVYDTLRLIVYFGQERDLRNTLLNLKNVSLIRVSLKSIIWGLIGDFMVFLTTGQVLVHFCFYLKPEAMYLLTLRGEFSPDQFSQKVLS